MYCPILSVSFQHEKFRQSENLGQSEILTLTEILICLAKASATFLLKVYVGRDRHVPASRLT